jgi:hypothetical protein
VDFLRVSKGICAERREVLATVDAKVLDQILTQFEKDENSKAENSNADNSKTRNTKDDN